MLLIDRRNEFRELTNVVKISTGTKDWEEFILKMCLDVSDVFKAWAVREEIISLQTANKTLTFLRQLSKNKSSMIEVTPLLNIAYTLAEEFKAIYKGIE